MIRRPRFVMPRRVRRSAVFEGQDPSQVVLDGFFELRVRARPRVAIGPPAIELRGVAEADAFHVFVAGLDHALRSERRERQILAHRPAAPFGIPRGPCTIFLSGPRPRKGPATVPGPPVCGRQLVPPCCHALSKEGRFVVARDSPEDGRTPFKSSVAVRTNS